MISVIPINRGFAGLASQVPGNIQLPSGIIPDGNETTNLYNDVKSVLANHKQMQNDIHVLSETANETRPWLIGSMVVFAGSMLWIALQK